ncbi:MAG: hypothetical protein RR190_04845 [Bacteroidales bacterium]
MQTYHIKSLLFIVLVSSLFSSFTSIQSEEGVPRSKTNNKQIEKEIINARILTEKRNYIQKNLPLSPEEALKFWPIYTAFEEVRSQGKPHFNQDLSAFTNEEQMRKANEIIARKEKMLQSEMQYLKDLREILPATKIVELWKAEKNFHRELIRSVKNNGPQEKRP